MGTGPDDHAVIFELPLGPAGATLARLRAALTPHLDDRLMTGDAAALLTERLGLTDPAEVVVMPFSVLGPRGVRAP